MIKCKTFRGYSVKIEEDVNKFLQSITLNLEDIKFTQSENDEEVVSLTLFYQIK